jgi:hypothetical protein
MRHFAEIQSDLAVTENFVKCACLAMNSAQSGDIVAVSALLADVKDRLSAIRENLAEFTRPTNSSEG